METESEAGSRLWAVSKVRGSNSGEVRSWPELKLEAQLTEPPRHPYFFFIIVIFYPISLYHQIISLRHTLCRNYISNKYRKSFFFPEILFSLLSMFSLLSSKLDYIWPTLLSAHQHLSPGQSVIFFFFLRNIFLVL